MVMYKQKIIRSKRRTISVEITKDLSVLIRAPLSVSDKQISAFLERKSAWIDRNIEIVKQRNEKNASVTKFSNDEIKLLVEKSKEVIPNRVEYYAQIIGVKYGRITIRNQVSRWGSCSSKGNLNFNCLLMLVPKEILDYVVVHELCHLKEMNHSKRFWNEVRNIIPDYETHRKWLKENGYDIIGRLKNS